MDNWLHDISWAHAFHSEGLTDFFKIVTELGYTTFFMLFLPLGYWLWDKAMFTRLTVIIMLTAIVNAFLKDFFQDPRPAVEWAIDPRTSDSFGMPSGHAQVAAAMWLWLAWELKRSWAWAAAIIIVVLVGLSRIYLGVHDVEDVLSGTALGIATLPVAAILFSSLFSPWHQLPGIVQVSIILSALPVLLLVWPVEQGPRGTAAIVTFMAGWWAGVLYDRKRLEFKRHPNWIIALVGAVIGAGLVAAGLPIAIKALVEAGVPSMWAQVAMLGLIGLFITLIAPIIFRKLRMAG